MADFDWTSLIGPAVGAAASIWGGNQNANAAKDALQTQQAGAGAATAAQSPYLAIGQNAANLLGNEDITKLPGYQSGLDAGYGAIDRGAAARGGFNSGNRQKALVKYATDYNAGKTADRENQLMRLLGIGSGAAGNVGNIQTGLGNVGAASGIAQNKATTSGITGALDLASKYLTSKDSSGQTNASNLWNSASSGLSGLFGGGGSSGGGNAFDADFDYWA